MSERTDMPLHPSKYQVKLRQVAAAQAHWQLQPQQSAYLGVSMNNPNFWHPAFKEVLRWMAVHFQQPYLLVGDWLNRWNEQIFAPPSVESDVKSLELGDRFLELFQHDIQLHGFRVLRWQSLLAHEGFEPAHLQVLAAYNQSTAFRDILHFSAIQFVQSQQNRGRKPLQPMPQTLELCAHYLLEELSVFLLLIRQGISVQVYPGLQLAVLAQLHKPNAFLLPPDFEQGVYIELNVKKR